MTSSTVALIVGARPQFVKAVAVARAIVRFNRKNGARRLRQTLVHTGQHYDYEMSRVFFREFRLPEPDWQLNVGSGSHGVQTGEMLKRVESVLRKERPDWVVVCGDTNTTLAGALAAAKLRIPVAHVEAGLRSGNRGMAEEINRTLTDRLSSLLFCPSERARRNLEGEGIHDGVHIVGDVMLDVLRSLGSRARGRRPGPRGPYAVATIHRAENTDAPERLERILNALDRLAANHFPVILPLHPRTRKVVRDRGLSTGACRVILPLPYGRMIRLMSESRVVLTDSGGVQKEAVWLGVPCVTMRDETEWPETVESGWNRLSGCDPERIVEAALRPAPRRAPPRLYGDGRAAEHIVERLSQGLGGPNGSRNGSNVADRTPARPRKGAPRP